MERRDVDENTLRTFQVRRSSSVVDENVEQKRDAKANKLMNVHRFDPFDFPIEIDE